MFPIGVRAVAEERAMAKRLLWTEDANAKLRSLAGTKAPAAVAAELGRSVGAVMVQASKLKLSVAYYKKRRASFYNPHSAPGF